MARAIDITGVRFGRLVAVKPIVRRGSRVWVCRCDCGGEATVSAGALRHGRTRSCGCLHRESIAAIGRASARHRAVGTPTHSSWHAMMLRAGTGSHRDRVRYLDRGITVCERWRKFENFLADMGERPPGTSIDRIDNSRGYEPGNCRWATVLQQQRNRSSNRLLTWNGETLTTAEWAERTGIERHTIGYRIRNGWSVEDALTIPVSRSNRWRNVG